jgi:hypothetical protein
MLSALLLVVLLATAFGVGTAFAATGCFLDTNGHIYETAICWLKANGIVSGTIFSPNTAATRATVAQWLYKQSQIPPTKGVILISAGNTGWHSAYHYDNFLFDHFPTSTIITNPSTGDGNFFLEPDIPIALYGRKLQLLGVEFCYTASASAQLDFLDVNILNSSAGFGNSYQKFVDNTLRSDNACRYNVLPTPYTLTADDSVVLRINIHWVNANYPFTITRTTFVLRPTGSKVYAPADSLDSVILDEATGEEPLP